MHSFAEWLRNHPVASFLIPIAVGLLGNVYSGNLKRFLHQWPRSKRTMRAGARNIAITRLEQLKHLHPGNAYNLLFYFALHFIGFVFESLAWVVLVTIVSWVAHWKVPEGVFFGLVGGVFLGRYNTVRKVLWDLNDYDHSVAKLEKQIADVQPVLDKPAES